MKRLMKRALTGVLTGMPAGVRGGVPGSRAHLPTGVMLAALIALLTAGCASTPDRYYTLVAPMSVVAPASPVAVSTGAAPLYIELAPITLPERLARPQLVVRRQGTGSAAQIDILEQHRWSSSFENELRDALASGIASRLGAIDATKGGKPGGQAIWRIAVQVRQFDAVENSRVDADLGWTLKRSDQERGVTCQWTVSEPVGAASGIDGLAQAAQRLTAKAAEAIGRNVGALEGGSLSACQR